MLAVVDGGSAVWGGFVGFFVGLRVGLGLGLPLGGGVQGAGVETTSSSNSV